jgi:hypothetical protein
MSLLDRVRDAQDEPARHRSSSRAAGPATLSVAQLRAMERALEREGFGDRDDVDHALGAEAPPPSAASALPPPPPPPPPAPPVAAEPLAAEPFAADEPFAAEPLPWWTPPAPAPSTDACPRCGDTAAIQRIDLTANAGWFACGSCGRRWGGSIERAEVGPLAGPSSHSPARAEHGRRRSDVS